MNNALLLSLLFLCLLLSSNRPMRCRLRFRSELLIYERKSRRFLWNLFTLISVLFFVLFLAAINREKTSTKRERGESYVIKVYSSSSLKREQKRDNAQ